MSNGARSDEDLMDAVRKGDDSAKAALTGLWSRHDAAMVRPRIARAIYPTVPDREGWIDVGSQMVWMNVWDGRNTWDRTKAGTAGFPGWLSGITRSVISDLLTAISRGSRCRGVGEEVGPGATGDNEWLIDLADVMLRALVWRCSPNDRNVVCCRYFLVPEQPKEPRPATNVELEALLVSYGSNRGPGPTLRLAEVMYTGFLEPIRTFEQVAHQQKTNMSEVVRACARFKQSVRNEWGGEVEPPTP